MSILKVDAIRHNSATSDAITMAADGTCTGNITNRPNYNLLINGQFDIWQRGTTSSSTNSSGYLSADRWRFEASGATYTTSRQAFAPGQTDVPSNPKYYLRFNVTTANDNTGITQRIEDVDSVQGEHTLSFWAKGTNPAGGSIQVTLLQDFGSGGSSIVSAQIGTFSVSGTWTKKTITFTPTSISGKTIGTSSYFKISIRQPSADDTTTAWALDIANVKLEAGSKATDYQRVGFTEELTRCYRYYRRFGANGALPTPGTYNRLSIGYSPSSTEVRFPFQLDPPMRISPVNSNFSKSGSFSIQPGTIGSYSLVCEDVSSSPNMMIANMSNTSVSSGSGSAVSFHANNDTSAYIDISAEL